MAQYLRVVRRGKNNVRVELPDHTTQLVPVSELPLWELVVALANHSSNTEVINLDTEMANIDQENTQEESQAEDTSTSEKVEVVEETSKKEVKEKKSKKESKPKEAKPKKTEKASYKAGNFRKNTNGLGVDHPYETVDTNVETVEYADGVEAPF
jgi:hypothetical protein